MTPRQPSPTPNDHPATWHIVLGNMEDRIGHVAKGDLVAELEATWEAMYERHRAGVERHGLPLQPHNGRDSVRSALDDVLDLRAHLENVCIENPSSTEARNLAEAVHHLCRRVVMLRRRLAEKGGG